MQKRFYVKEGNNGKHSSLILVLFIVVFIIVIILVGLYILGANARQIVKKELPPIPTPTVISHLSPTSVASVSATVSTVSSSPLARSALRIRVLNGSGMVGAASGISSYLSGLGYTVVSVGNADSYEYRNVTVLVKTSKSSYAQLLKKDLQDKISSVSASLSDDISSDAEVIVGK